MAHWFADLDPWLRWLLSASAQASVLVVLIIGVQLVLGRWLSPSWRYALWGLVVVRLLMPIAPGSPWSVFNLVPAEPTPAVSAAPLPPMDFTLAVPSEPLVASPRPVAPVQRTQVADPITWSRVLMWTWAGGAMLFAVWVAGSHLRLSRRIARDRREPNDDLERLLQACRERMNIRRRVRVVLTDAAAGPALMGVFRPRILLPGHLVTALSRDQLRHVLMHELAHLRRHDIAVNWLLIALTALHWFNPLVWFAFHRLRSDREPLRDAMVLRRTGTDTGQAYGQTIIRVLEELTRPRLGNPALAGITESRRQMRRRIRLIADFGRRPRKWLAAVGILALLFLAAIGLTDAAEPGTPANHTTTTAIHIQPGDLIEINVFELLQSGRDYSETHRVSHEGNVKLPYAGQISVVGRTTEEARIRVIESLREQKIMRNPAVRIAIRRSANDPPEPFTPLKRGDHLQINIFELVNPGEDYSQHSQVNEQGRIKLPHLNEVTVQGLTTEAVEQLLVNRLKDKVLSDPQVRVELSADAMLALFSDPHANTSFIDKTASAEQTEKEQNRRTRQKLDDPIPAEFDAVSFDQFLEYLRNVTGTNVWINWNALEPGVTPDSKVTLNLPEPVSARLVLDMVLEQVGDEFNPAAWEIQDGVVAIGTRRSLWQSDLRVYDIRDLLVQIPDFSFDPDEPAPPSPTRGELVEQVVTLIQDTIGRLEDWVTYGGDLSSIRELNGQLIVETSTKNHRAIVDLLAQLRETRRVQISFESRFVVVPLNFGGDAGFELPAARQPGTPAPHRIIDDIEAKMILDAVRTTAEALTLAAPRVTQFSGQEAEALLASEVTPFRDIAESIEGKPKQTVLAVTEEGVWAGVQMKTTAAASPDRRSVAVDLHAVLANPRRSGEAEPGGEGVEAELNLSIPDRGTLLVDLGTIKGPIQHEKDDVDHDTPRRVLLLTQPTIIIVQSEEMKSFPGLLESPNAEAGR